MIEVVLCAMVGVAAASRSGWDTNGENAPGPCVEVAHRRSVRMPVQHEFGTLACQDCVQGGRVRQPLSPGDRPREWRVVKEEDPAHPLAARLVQDAFKLLQLGRAEATDG